MGREAGDLGKVSHADHLVGLAQERQFFADDVAESAADVGVDFIEDQRADRVVLRQHGLQGEHRPRHLAARGHLAKRPKRFARVGGQQKLQTVGPAHGRLSGDGVTQVDRLEAAIKPGAGHAKIDQMLLRLCHQFFADLVAGFSQRFRRRHHLRVGGSQFAIDAAEVVFLPGEFLFPAIELLAMGDQLFDALAILGFESLQRL